MKKWTLLIAVLALVASLFVIGCGNDNAADDNAADDPAVEQPAGDSTEGEDNATSGAAPAQPADHAGRWADGGETAAACTTCHTEAEGAMQLPESHLAGETLDNTRANCNACHQES